MQSALFGRDVLHPTGQVAILVLNHQQVACGACPLAKERKLVVPGEGNAEKPLIMFVGEAPGANENETGRPFVGKAGQLLDKMLEAMGLKREDVYITNVVGCRPPENRKPESEEIKACSKWLTTRIEAVRPQFLVALGGTAAQTLLKSTKAISQLRGYWWVYGEIPLRCTYHPAFLLRPNSQDYKKMAWSDLQAVLKRANEHDGDSG